MNAMLFGVNVAFLAAVFLLVSGGAFAASVSPALLKAKQQAEAKGYLFETSHDEIVGKAKKGSEAPRP